MSVFHQENGNVHKKEKLCESLNKNRFKKAKKEEQKGNVCFCYGVNILTCVLYMSLLSVNPLKLHLILDIFSYPPVLLSIKFPKVLCSSNHGHFKL